MILQRIASFTSAFILSVISLTVLYTPTASAATLTWTGAGGDLNFSTAENWSGGIAPVEGDDLVFDNDTFDFGDLETQNWPNNDLAGVGFNSLTSQGAGQSSVTLTGNDFTLTAGIDAPALLNISGANINLAANQTFSGSVNLKLDQDDNGGTLDIAEYTLTAMDAPSSEFSDYVALRGLAGSGVLDVSVPVSVMNSSDNFTGDVTVRAGSSFNLPINQTNNVDTSLTIEDGAWLKLCGSDFEYAGNLTVGGAGNIDGFPSTAITFTEGLCGGGKGGGTATVPPETNYTVSGTTTLTADTKILASQNQTITFSDVALNGFTLELTEDSSGVLVINDEEVANEPKTVTIEAGDDNPDESVNVLAQDTLVLNGTRGFVSVSGILKGTGTATYIAINGGATLAPGLSPGCIETGTLDFASTGTYEVEIAGTVACDEYDQMQVSSAVNLGNEPTLNVSFLDDFVPEQDDNFVIIDNQSSDPVNGAFSGMAEGEAFEVDGVTFSITYEGGDGNDVVLTVLEVDPDLIPDAPDTGFTLLSSNPAATLAVTIFASTVLLAIARRYKSVTSS